jgi:hypothetical protein
MAIDTMYPMTASAVTTSARRRGARRSLVV